MCYSREECFFFLEFGKIWSGYHDGRGTSLNIPGSTKHPEPLAAQSTALECIHNMATSFDRIAGSGFRLALSCT